MNKSLLTFVFILTLIGKGTQAQTGLGMNDSLFFLTSNDTLTGGSTITYSAYVFNTTNVSYSGNINYYIGVDSAGTQGTTLSSIDTTSDVSSDTIPANDSMSRSGTINVGPQFRSGINTVVIWPVAEASSGFVTIDSAKFDIYVMDINNIKNGAQAVGLTIYPNPFSEKIRFLTKGSIIIEEVRILDALGRVLLVDKDLERQFIETTDLPQGFYFIELSYNNGVKTCIKMMKQ